MSTLNNKCPYRRHRVNRKYSFVKSFIQSDHPDPRLASIPENSELPLACLHGRKRQHQLRGSILVLLTVTSLIASTLFILARGSDTQHISFLHRLLNSEDIDFIKEEDHTQEENHVTRGNLYHIQEKNVTKVKNVWPKVAWLLTFPNSGTSYTTDLVQRASNRSIGSNYHHLDYNDLDENGYNIPYHPEARNGPYLHKISKKRPERYVLTKTHCEGKCSNCPPKRYLTSLESFTRSCLTGWRTFPNSTTGGKLQYAKESYTYEQDIVEKAVHLFRNPFDNIVSRFHNHLKKEVSENDKDYLSTHPRNREGFRKWCMDMDKQHYKEEIYYFGAPLARMSRKIPCHADFYRYINWHNKAFEVTESAGISTKILYYEEYGSNFNDTVKSVLDFLELNWEREPPAFRQSNYSDYFTERERSIAKALMKYLASDDTLNALEYYF